MNPVIHGHVGEQCSSFVITVSVLIRSRSFEFLGACSSGNTTRAPGPESFTKALIWALQYLAQHRNRFLVSELSCKIREAPHFPDDQIPVQIERGPGSIERIMLAPLAKVSGEMEKTQAAPGITAP